MVRWKIQRTVLSVMLELQTTPKPSISVTMATTLLEMGSEHAWTPFGLGLLLLVFVSLLNPLTSVSHWSGFKVKLTFHGVQFVGSSLILGKFGNFMPTN